MVTGRGSAGLAAAALAWIWPAPAAELSPDVATCLGGQSRVEEWNAVDVAPDGTIVLAGSAPDFALKGVPEHWLMAGGYGVVVRVKPSPFEVLSVSRIGDWVDDMELAGDGRIAVVGSFGAAVVSPDGTRLLWRDANVIRGTKAAQFRNQTPPFKNDRYTKRVSRVAAGEDGAVASIQMEEKVWDESAPKLGRLYVWDADGRRTADVPLVNYKYPQDLTVSSKHGLVCVGGFNTYKHDSSHMKDHPIHMQFLTAYTLAGEVRWAAYDFPAKDVYEQNTFADCRVQRLQIGRDGMLHMGGYIHGGDYVWRHDPFDVRRRVNADTGYDSFSVASNMGRGIDQAYFAKFDPETGRILQGQVLLCRREPSGGGKPTQIQITGIHADEEGNVYMAGYCEAFIRQRDLQVVAGTPVGPYHRPEPFVLVVTPDFRRRLVWTVFARQSCEAAAWGLSVRDGRAAFVGEVYEGEAITLPDALQPAPAGPVDGYLVSWRTRQQ